MKEKKIICPICGKEFKQTRYWQKYCSSKCRKEAFNQRHNIGLKEQIRKQNKEIEKIKEKLGIK